MKALRWTLLPAVLAASAFAAAAGAQDTASAARARNMAAASGQQSDSGFYDGRAPLTLTLTANFDRLRRDRQADPPWRTAAVTFTDSAGAAHTVPVRVRTRGIWRRRNCHLPPLRLDFVRRQLVGTPLHGLNRPKLVQYCQDQDRAEQYILQELQLYRIYALLTPMSHRVRAVRLTYVDSGSARVRTTRYAFFLEEPRALARRLGAEELAVKGSVSDDLDARTRVLMGVFQYMIGNTDWSTSGLHNVELFGRDGVIYPVAYDFDYSGAVNAHYAVPPPQVRIRSVRERAYRGACAADSVFADVFAAFRANRQRIQELYADEVGRLLDPAVAKRMLRYFDEFYEVIDDPRAAKREIIDRCTVTQ